MSVVLFDLEGTLVDTSAIAAARERRDWASYCNGIVRTSLYDQVAELLATLHERGIRWAVVTNLPDRFASKILAHHHLTPATGVFYHDAPGRPKPHPDLVHLALKRLQVAANDAVGVGDTWKDADAFRAANVRVLCAGWNPDADIGATWSHVLRAPDDLLDYL